jgi:hypothetical protein
VNQRAIDCPTNQLTGEASYSSFDNGLIVGLLDDDTSTNYKPFLTFSISKMVMNSICRALTKSPARMVTSESAPT